jgi:hypothetical protein
VPLNPRISAIIVTQVFVPKIEDEICPNFDLRMKFCQKI